MKVMMMLADFAQAVNGKLYIMGGGWSLTGPMPNPSAIAIKIEVPWDEANRKHNLKLELMDSDDRPVLVPAPARNTPLTISCDFEVVRPAGIVQGTPIDVPIAFNMGPIPLESGKRFVWKLSIDGNAKDEWQLAFSTRQSS